MRSYLIKRLEATHGLGHASVNIIMTCNARVGGRLVGEYVVFVGLHSTASFRIIPETENTWLMYQTMKQLQPK